MRFCHGKVSSLNSTLWRTVTVLLTARASSSSGLGIGYGWIAATFRLANPGVENESQCLETGVPFLVFSSFDGCRHKTRNVALLSEAGDVAADLDLSNTKHFHATQPFSEHRFQLSKPFRL